MLELKYKATASRPAIFGTRVGVLFEREVVFVIVGANASLSPPPDILLLEAHITSP
jgi:hypothetical protein